MIKFKFPVGSRLTHRDRSSRHHLWVVVGHNQATKRYTIQKLEPCFGNPFDYPWDDVERQLIQNSHIRRP